MGDNVAEKLKTARLKLSLTQQQASEGSGIPQKEISRIESGLRLHIPNRYISYLLQKGVDINSIYNESAEEVDFITKSGSHNKNVEIKSRAKSVGNSKSKQLPLQIVREPYDQHYVSPAPDTISVSLVNVRAAAGWTGSAISDEHVVKETFQMPVSMLRRGLTYAAFPVVGESMEPTIYAGDTILAFLVNPSEWVNLKDDYIYVIITKEGVAIKRTLNRLKERGCLRLKSDNHQKSPYEVTEEDIVSIWQAKAKLSFNFAYEQADIQQRLSDIEYRLEMIERK